MAFEAPAGEGFGAAALSLAPKFFMNVSGSNPAEPTFYVEAPVSFVPTDAPLLNC